jgi:UDP-glucose 4-epimerase
MRILITGGFGFIGGRLASYLSDSDTDVILGTRKSNVKPPEWLPKSKAVQTQWINISSLENICKGVDVVVHAAGMNASDCFSNPVEALTVNGLYTANLLYSAISSGVKKFIYISTGHVYNHPLEGVVSESTKADNLNPYASSHRTGEDLVRNADHQNLIEGTVIRLSNGYGAPVHIGVNCWMLLVNDLCRQAVETGEMIINSSGSQQRDFIPMSSVCKIIHTMVDSDRSDCADNLFNVGSGCSMSVWEMGNLVKSRCEAVLGKKITLSRFEILENNSNFQYSISKLNQTNINYKIDHNQEIDDLVRFCVLNYS